MLVTNLIMFVLKHVAYKKDFFRQGNRNCRRQV